MPAHLVRRGGAFARRRKGGTNGSVDRRCGRRLRRGPEPCAAAKGQGADTRPRRKPESVPVDDTGRKSPPRSGAAPAAVVSREPCTRAAPGLRRETLRSPARSWLGRKRPAFPRLFPHREKRSGEAGAERDPHASDPKRGPRVDKNRRQEAPRRSDSSGGAPKGEHAPIRACTMN